jgi:hypothetical protein
MFTWLLTRLEESSISGYGLSPMDWLSEKALGPEKTLGTGQNGGSLGLPRRRGYRTQPRVSTLGILKRFALKGREMRVPDEARTYCRRKSQSAQLRRATFGPSAPASALLGRSIWRPFIRARHSWWTIPRVETQG